MEDYSTREKMANGIRQARRFAFDFRPDLTVQRRNGIVRREIVRRMVRFFGRDKRECEYCRDKDFL